MAVKQSRTRRPLSRAHQTIAEILYDERTRPRPGRPTGFAVNEIPRGICGASTLDRMETGTQARVNPSTVTDLMLRVYASDVSLITKVAELAEATLEPNWWDAYRPNGATGSWLYQYHESRATQTRWHSSNYVQALLQCREYVDAMFKNLAVQAAHPEPTDIPSFYDLRLQRIEHWLESDRQLTAVIGEAALMLNLGPGVQEAQKRHLLQLDALPHVEIYVAPLNAGRYPVIGYEYTIFDFDDDPVPLIASLGDTTTYVDPTSELGVFYQTGFDEGVQKSIRISEYANA